MAYSPIINCPICGRVCQSNAPHGAVSTLSTRTTLREKFLRLVYLHTTCYSCGINFKAGRVQTAIRNALGVRQMSIVRPIEYELIPRRDRPPAYSHIPKSGVLGARPLQKIENTSNTSQLSDKEKPFLLEIHNRSFGLHFRIEIDGKSPKGSGSLWSRTCGIIGSVVSTAESELLNFLELKKVPNLSALSLTEQLQKSVEELNEAKRIIETLSTEASKPAEVVERLANLEGESAKARV